MPLDRTPRVVVFDVNETLSDLSPLGSAFAAAGLPEHAAPLWFAGILRDGFALTAAGTNPRFADLAADSLRTLLAGAVPAAQAEPAVERIMGAFGSLGVHPDVPDGLAALHADGHRLATLSNGSAAEGLLQRAGLRGLFESVLSVEQAPAWKPARAAYDYGTRSCGVRPEEALLVAVHPWDVDGAARAGLRTAWVRRGAARYPGHFTRADVEVGDLRELAGALGAAPSPAERSRGH